MMTIDGTLWVEDGIPYMVYYHEFEGKMMMILHSPYNGDTRPHLFEMEDTAETLKIIREFTGN